MSTNWISTIHTDTTEPWMEPEEPAMGEKIRLTIRLSKIAPIDQVWVRVILNGIDHHYPAERTHTGEEFAWYRAQFDLKQPSTHFHLLVRTTEGRTLYWNRAGASWVFPNEDHDFTINTACHVPAWVRSSVFYQIFPDRFNRGDERLGVADGEITRGRFTSRAMSWDQRPLPYQEGGSLDFFNGDLPGIEAKLDYLADLGINAIYLTPIFTARTNHRYDCLDYFSVDPHLGGDTALISLLRAAYARGIRVMLDVSINHVAVEHEWTQGLPVERDARSTAEPTGTADLPMQSGGAGSSDAPSNTSPSNEAQSDKTRVRVIAEDENGNFVNWLGVPDLLKLDYTVPQLRETIYRKPESVVQRYLREPFGIDGWRFDVASETGRLGAHQDGHELWQEIRRAIRENNPEAYIIGEHWHDASAYLQGDQWDSAMNYFGSGRLVRMWLGERDRFASVPCVEAQAGRHITGRELKTLLEQHFTRIPNGVVHAQFNLVDSHDVTRLHNNTSTFDWPVYEGAIMLAFLLPGTFSIYYGDEVGIGGTLNGDHGKRYPMPWNKDAWDDRFVTLYRSMIALKRGSEVLHRGSYRILDAGEDYLVYARFTDRLAMVLLLNRRDHQHTWQINLAPIGAVTADIVGPAALRPAQLRPSALRGGPGGDPESGQGGGPEAGPAALRGGPGGASPGGTVKLRDGVAEIELAPRQSVLLRCEVSD